jgi:hypothetical protein
MVKNITIVTEAAESKKWFIDTITEKFDIQWNCIDLREVLSKDPSTSIGHKEDWQYEQTQQVVIAQDGFPHVIQEIIDMADYDHHFFIHCRTGYHRGSVTGKMVESQLNSLIDADGNRRFNAMLFMFHDCYNVKTFKTKYLNVVDWVGHPWEIEGEYNGLKDSLFGYRASMATGASARNWNFMNDNISAKYKRIGMTNAMFNPAPSFDMPSGSPSFVMPPPTHSPPMPSHIMPPRPPPPMPPRLTSVAKVMPPRPRPPQTPPAARAYAMAEWEGQLQEQSQDQSQEQSQDWDEKLPDWAWTPNRIDGAIAPCPPQV